MIMGKYIKTAMENITRQMTILIITTQTVHGDLQLVELHINSF